MANTSLQSCDIQDSHSPEIVGIFGGIVELPSKDPTNWYVIPICETHMSHAYSMKGSNMAPMMTNETAIALRIPVKSTVKKSNETNQIPELILSTEDDDDTNDITNDVQSISNVKVYTQRDFEPIQFDSNDQCLLKIPVFTNVIEEISMEYEWHSEGRYLHKGQFLYYVIQIWGRGVKKSSKIQKTALRNIRMVPNIMSNQLMICLKIVIYLLKVARNSKLKYGLQNIWTFLSLKKLRLKK